jgi:phenylpropionate dioxygenase-like ring-hydroxylating dioxygenase large terminal subunit
MDLKIFHKSKLPLSFIKSMEPKKPITMTLLNKPYMIWNNNVFENRCPHRAASLSDGRITVDGRIECGYHGWQFDSGGHCRHIPQSNITSFPKACHVPTLSTVEHDGILWASTNDSTLHPAISAEHWTDDDAYLVTDYSIDAPYSALIQIENLLDPAHIHFVHHGFQGNRDRAGPIKSQMIKSNDQELSASFTHEGDSPVPEIIVSFFPPCVVDVSILNSKREIARKNIIYVTPMTAQSCRVLFRDVLFRDHVNYLFDSAYKLLNTAVIKTIIQQDLKILCGQQRNIDDYFDTRYVMMTEADILIRQFKRWLQFETQKFDST